MFGDAIDVGVNVLVDVVKSLVFVALLIRVAIGNGVPVAVATTVDHGALNTSVGYPQHRVFVIFIRSIRGVSSPSWQHHVSCS